VPRVSRPVPNLDDAFFWEGVEQGELLLSACARCGRLQHPPSPMCPSCGSLEWDRRRATGRGTVHSWIVSRHPTEPDDDPRIVALIDLAEGVRLVSNITECPAESVRNGMNVVVTFAELDGVRLPQFRPAT
jgi:uncharacterized protein